MVQVDVERPSVDVLLYRAFAVYPKSVLCPLPPVPHIWDAEGPSPEYHCDRRVNRDPGDSSQCSMMVLMI